MRYHRISLGLLLTIGLIGCGAETPDFPAVAPVTGSVTYQGKPVEGASVRFVPATPGEESYPAMATTDAEGNYTLSTTFSPSSTQEGAVPGNYRVLVVKRPQVKVDPNAAHHQTSARQPGPKDLLPRQFSLASSTPLNAQVQANQNNEVPLDLGS